jgi:hypothetical protein
MNDGRLSCENAGWHLTFSSNHWATLEPCKDFMEKILSPYKVSQVKELGVEEDQEMIWLMFARVCTSTRIFEHG